MNICRYLIHFPLRKPSRYYTWLVYLLFLVSISFAITPLSEEIHGSALEIMDKIYKEEFRLAEEQAKKLTRRYPDHPAGYFFTAAALDSWMAYYQSNKKENEFYNYCDLTVEKCEKMLSKDPSDEWALFFMGGAEGYKGTFEIRYERWITAFRYGWKGVSILMQLENKRSSIADIYYGIGSYEYWRSALMKMLWWMPGVEDKREEGLNKLKLTCEKGLYTRIPSSMALIDILNNEKRYDEALAFANSLLKAYPSCSMFLWGKGKALAGTGKLADAEYIFTQLLKKYESDEENNHYNEILCHFWIARMKLSRSMYAEAIAECIICERLDISADIKKRLESVFRDVADIKHRAKSGLK